VTTPPAGPAAADEEKKKKDKNAPIEPEVLKFRIIGQTVDIQALTRFMKLLELSPFVKNIQLARSELVAADGKDVTEFTLDAEYERPDPSVLTTVPVSLSSR
jgi:hypothetical protein